MRTLVSPNSSHWGLFQVSYSNIVFQILDIRIQILNCSPVNIFGYIFGMGRLYSYYTKNIWIFDDIKWTVDFFKYSC